MKVFNSTFLLRVAIAAIFLSHSLHGIFKNDVNDFGTLFLDKSGFAPLGIYIAWFVILSQVVGSFLLLFNTFVKPVTILFILILIGGIILVHFKEGWYVVGAGSNGVEFSFVLICCLLSILFPRGFFSKPIAVK